MTEMLLVPMCEEDDDTSFPYDMSKAEDVLVQVLFEKGYAHMELNFETVTVLGDDCGAASFEHGESGCLDYMLLQQVDTEDFPQGEGWYVFEEVKITYIRSDGWTTDNDAELEYKSIRSATAEEIAEA